MLGFSLLPKATGVFGFGSCRLLVLHLSQTESDLPMDELQDRWRKFKLTEVEGSIIEDDAESTEIKEQPWVFSIARLQSIRPFNATALINLMKSIWKLVKTVVVDTIDENCLLFKFHSRADVVRVLEGRPWFFDKHVFMIAEASGETQPSKLIMNATPFWLRIYDLPINAWKENTISRLVQQAGHVMQVCWSDAGDFGRHYARVRVEIPILEPLTQGARFKSAEKEPIFLPFKYKRLQHFCFPCGRLGHVDRECEFLEGENQYGTFLRASPVVKRGRTTFTARSNTFCTTDADKTRSHTLNNTDKNNSVFETGQESEGEKIGQVQQVNKPIARKLILLEDDTYQESQNNKITESVGNKSEDNSSKNSDSMPTLENCSNVESNSNSRRLAVGTQIGTKVQVVKKGGAKLAVQIGNNKSECGINNEHIRK